MGHTNSTPNLSLPQFVGSDKPTWLSDINGAMLAIDAAYGTIQAEASSAATAASGAVTAADAAQTAADAAATAAATAGTNASQALSTANNAATVALQAQNDASDAKDVATGDAVIATVTADGTETMSHLLDRLYALIDWSRVSAKSVVKVGTYVMRLATEAEGVRDFAFAFGNTTSIYVAKIRLLANDSQYRWFSVDSNGFRFDNLDSEIESIGFTITVYE